MGALNTRKIFFIPALAPAMLNITLILSIIFFEARAKQPLTAAAVGVMVGGFVQFVFQLPLFFKNKYSLGFDATFTHPGLKRMSVLLVPATLALSVSQVNIVVSNILASFLPSGSITYLFYSMRLTQFPIGIFGVAMGMAVLPMLSEHAVRGEYDKLRDDFSFALRLLFFITVPAMAGLIALREPIVNVLFQRGRFDYAATVGTAQALLFYSIGIWSVVGVRVVTASFYSMQDTRTPVKVALVALTANILFSVILMRPMKHSGLALANALASWVNFVLLFFFLRKRLGRVDGRKIALSFARSVFAASVMGLTGGMLLQGELWRVHGETLNKVFYLGGTMLICVAMYVLVSYFLKNEELSYVINIIRQKYKR